VVGYYSEGSVDFEVVELFSKKAREKEEHGFVWYDRFKVSRENVRDA
jgi:hypothetical protein